MLSCHAVFVANGLRSRTLILEDLQSSDLVASRTPVALRQRESNSTNERYVCGALGLKYSETFGKVAAFYSYTWHSKQ